MRSFAGAWVGWGVRNLPPLHRGRGDAAGVLVLAHRLDFHDWAAPQPRRHPTGFHFYTRLYTPATYPCQDPP